MLSFLKKHPFPVEAYFDYSLVLAYAFEAETLKTSIPSCLELDLYEDRWAFLAVAMVQTRDLRPKGFPKFMGNDFFLVGYRIFVRYRSQDGRRKRGLYILKSETDKRRMAILGNLFTHYHYTRAPVTCEKKDDGLLTVTMPDSGFLVKARVSNHTEVPLPAGSPFPSWSKARLFSGPLPFTFSVDGEKEEIVIIEGVRENWSPRPVQIGEHQVPFLKEFSDETPKLANAFMTEGIPYEWKKGSTEPIRS